MPTVFKSAGIKLSSTSPQDAWTATAGAQTMLTALFLTNLSGSTTTVTASLYNATNGAVAVWAGDIGGQSSLSACVDKLGIIAGDKIQISNTAGVEINVVVSVAEAT